MNILYTPLDLITAVLAYIGLVLLLALIFRIWQAYDLNLEEV